MAGAPAVDELAEQRIRLFEAQCPEGLELATCVALTARVTQAHLRLARTTLLPWMPAAVEAEVWFSPLVETAHRKEIILVPEVGEMLRRRLAEVPGGRMQAARANVIEVLKPLRPPLMRFEDDILWVLARREPGSVAMAERMIGGLVRAAAGGGMEGIARWGLGFVERIAELRDVPAAQCSGP
jgi:hypothetical protein